MRPIINDPEAHNPHGPKLGLGYLAEELEDEDSANNFYQPPSADQLKLVDSALARAEEPAALTISMDEYQAWCELNWKKPHGTVLSAERLTAKLTEETHELKDALYQPEQPKEKIVDELGDVLWCTNALASELKVSVKHGMMMLLDRYGHGTRLFEDGGVPTWVKRAQELTFDSQLSADGLEAIINDGYESQESPVMLIDEPEQATDEEIDNALELIDINSRYLVSIARMNYETDLHQSGHTLRADVTEHLAARIYLDVAFLAKHAADSSLSEVIRANVIKLSDRVATDTVDKADNPRSNQDALY